MSLKKEMSPDSCSMSTFSHGSEQSEATKKSISTEEISMQNVDSIERQNFQSQVVLPFETHIKELIKHFQIKFEEMGSTVLYCDEKEGQLLVKEERKNECLGRFLDCLCFFRKEGFPRANIQQTFETISVTVKRQNIYRKCILTIKANIPKTKASKELKQYSSQLTNKAREIISTFKVKDPFYGQKDQLQIRNDSPLGQEIAAMNKIYNVLVKGGKDIVDERPKTLFHTAIQKYKKELLDGQEIKPNKEYTLIERMVRETNSIFNILMYNEDLRKLELNKDFILYSIQNLFCYNHLNEIFFIYKKNIKENCLKFRKNSQYINKNMSSRQYFDYLEVRERYRLSSQPQPYALAIKCLRELENSISLRDYLLCIQKTFSAIKVQCLEEHNGKIQISSMDDMLPVMIYICAKAQVENFPVYVKIIDDYVRIRDVFEVQERIITTLFVAVEDICKKLPDQKNI